MKIRIELEPELSEDEVIIRASSITPEITRLENLIGESVRGNQAVEFYKGDSRVYINLEEILFFETTDDGISAHSADDCFEVKYKLYELENMLPMSFMRVSKSTIINTREIFSIERNLYASSEVSFRNTFKKVFVSRHYYKALVTKLNDERFSF